MGKLSLFFTREEKVAIAELAAEAVWPGAAPLKAVFLTESDISKGG